MKLLLQFYKLDGGSIYLDGVNINEINVDSIRKNIIYINQKTTLFNDTILYNMKYGVIWDESRGISLDNYIISLLNHYDLLTVFNPSDENPTECLYKKIETNGNNISLGMQKVIFLIRGILQDCNVYIFDEPFTSIDPNTRDRVMNMIDIETKGKTVIIITHDKGFETILDEMIDMDTIRYKN